MSDLKSCAACGKKSPVGEMKTCMHAQMHRYVCDMKCMNDFYNPPPKPVKAMTDKPEVTLYQAYSMPVESTKEIQRLYPGAYKFVLASDHEQSRAADEARIAELMGLLATARDYVYSELQERKVNLSGYPQKWRIEEADLAAIDEALAQQGKEGGA